MMRSTVSVIMPCYNAERHVDDAIRSLREQSYSQLEILVVNDGSSDGTQARLERHAKDDARIRVFTQNNAGPSAARNTGLRNATGEYICFLDADDVLLPEKIERQRTFLDCRPEVDLVYSDYYTSDAELNLTALTAVRFPHKDALESIAMHNYFPPSIPMFRRSLMETAGAFDESLRMAEDWDYWLRCAKAGVFGYLPGATTIYREHPAQAHRDLHAMLRGGKAVLRKHFASDHGRHHRALASWYEANAKLRWAADRRFQAAVLLGFGALHRAASSAAEAFRPRIPVATINPVRYSVNPQSVKLPEREN